MEKELDDFGNTNKFYQEGAFGVGAFIGGPLVATYFLSENFKQLGQNKKVNQTWWIGVLCTICIFSIAIFLPDSVNIPGYVLPALYTGITFSIFRKYQKDDIQNSLDSGSKIHSWWRVIGITLLGLVITIVLLVLVVYTLFGEF